MSGGAARPGRGPDSSEPNHECFARNWASCLIAALGACYLASRPHAGEVAEWLNAPHSKCGIRATVSGVQIPPSPPGFQKDQQNSQVYDMATVLAALLAHMALATTRP